MPSPLEGSLAAAIGKGMSSLFLKAILFVDAPGSGPVYRPGQPSTISYPCRAIVDEWSAYDRSSGLVAIKDRKILILAATLDVAPEEGNRIQIQGQTFRIVSDGGANPAVSTDPATAVWVIRGRA